MSKKNKPVSRYYKESAHSNAIYTDEQIDFIIGCMQTNSDEEIADMFQKKYPDFNINPRKILNLINNLNLEEYLNPHKTDRVWELVKKNKVQCALCGRWLKSISHNHLKYKHGITLADYRLKFETNKTQSFCSGKTKSKFAEIAKSNQEKGIFMVGNPNIGEERPDSWNKSKQYVIEKTESGLQSKAAKSKRKPKAYRADGKVKNLIDRLKGENMSFVDIAGEVERELGYKISLSTVIRIFYNKRSNFSGR